MEQIISKIRESCSGLFDNGIYFSKLYNTYVLQGNSPALDNHNGIKTPVNVLHWYENFYIYIEINFIKQTIESKFTKDFNKKAYLDSLKKEYLEINSDFYNVVLSISIFQGDSNIDKRQLFRAEWDNYEGTQIHPQPHWHFYPEEKLTDAFDTEDSIDFLEDESQKEIDLKRVHFAMNGRWAQNNTHINRINNREDVVRWFVGVLSHIKKQLTESKMIRM